MIKQKKLDWKESNVELFGSDLDRGVKKESAMTEHAWKVVLSNRNPGLFIWRIEKFKVVEWPRQKYGQFYSGDSYIVLNVYKAKDSPELLYDIHFWIGMHSTQDEYGTAAYKTVELDTLLDDKPVQHREVEGYESDLFRSYFTTITYLKGGCDSGFRHVETKVTDPRLFHFSGDKARKIVVKEVKSTRTNLDSSDVFILDLGDVAYQWNGSASSKDERFQAQQYLRELVSQRNGKLRTEVLDEGSIEASHPFFLKLSDEATKKSFKSANGRPEAKPKQLFKLSDASGQLAYSAEASGHFGQERLNEEDVWIIDNGQTIYVYVGEGASYAEKKNALIYAHNYLKETSNPCLPVSVVGKNSQGPTLEEFKKVLAA